MSDDLTVKQHNTLEEATQSAKQAHQERGDAPVNQVDVARGSDGQSHAVGDFNNDRQLDTLTRDAEGNVTFDASNDGETVTGEDAQAIWEQFTSGSAEAKKFFDAETSGADDASGAEGSDEAIPVEPGEAKKLSDGLNEALDGTGFTAVDEFDAETRAKLEEAGMLDGQFNANSGLFEKDGKTYYAGQGPEGMRYGEVGDLTGDDVNLGAGKGISGLTAEQAAELGLDKAFQARKDYYAELGSGDAKKGYEAMKKADALNDRISHLASSEAGKASKTQLDALSQKIAEDPSKAAEIETEYNSLLEDEALKTEDTKFSTDTAAAEKKVDDARDAKHVFGDTNSFTDFKDEAAFYEAAEALLKDHADKFPEGSDVRKLLDHIMSYKGKDGTNEKGAYLEAELASVKRLAGLDKKPGDSTTPLNDTNPGDGTSGTGGTGDADGTGGTGGTGDADEVDETGEAEGESGPPSVKLEEFDESLNSLLEKTLSIPEGQNLDLEQYNAAIQDQFAQLLTKAQAGAGKIEVDGNSFTLSEENGELLLTADKTSLGAEGPTTLHLKEDGKLQYCPDGVCTHAQAELTEKFFLRSDF